MKLTAIEKMLLDESDDSSDDQNDFNETAPVGKVKTSGSVRDEGLHVDSNEGSSIRCAPATNSVVNGGRPQRKKTNSKNGI